jgi:hypothetical protein
MYLESSSPNWPHVTSSLVSPKLPPAGYGTTLNLSFYYHMWGEDLGSMGTLRVDAGFVADVPLNSSLVAATARQLQEQQDDDDDDDDDYDDNGDFSGGPGGDTNGRRLLAQTMNTTTTSPTLAVAGGGGGGGANVTTGSSTKEEGGETAATMRVMNWTQVWRRAGVQGNAWKGAWVVLPQGTERVRFVGTTGEHWQSDMAIDDLVIGQGTPQPTPTPTSLTAFEVGVGVTAVLEHSPFNTPDELMNDGVGKGLTTSLLVENGTQLMASLKTYARKHNVSHVLSSLFTVVPHLWSTSTLAVSFVTAPNPTSEPTLLPTLSPAPTQAPTLQPSPMPAPEPSQQPTGVPSPKPSSLPSTTPAPSTSAPPSEPPTQAPSAQDYVHPTDAFQCASAANLSTCNTVLLGQPFVNPGASFSPLQQQGSGATSSTAGDDNDDVLYRLPGITSPQTILVVVCPVDSPTQQQQQQQQQLTFRPHLSLNDECPHKRVGGGGGLTALATSDETSDGQWDAANASLRLSQLEGNSEEAALLNETALHNASNTSSLSTVVDVDGSDDDNDDDNGLNFGAATNNTTTSAGNSSNTAFSSDDSSSSNNNASKTRVFELTQKCALVAFDITSEWLASSRMMTNDDMGGGGDDASDDDHALWLVVDGNFGNSSSSGGDASNSSDSGSTAVPSVTFNLGYFCTSAPSLVPTASPSNTPAPSPAPTTIPARRNCVCMSAGMIEGISEHCPRIAHLFVEGCMDHVTRADLEEITGYCPTLKLDWGPFFDFEDQHNGDGANGDWQRGKSEVGNKIQTLVG